jgi:predicted NAD/FAD-binding protein
VHFCANHGLLQVTDRPQWYTVAGGARRYVERIAATLDDVRASTPALSVARTTVDGIPKVVVRSRHGASVHDHVVFACHSDQTLRLLDDASVDERVVLGAIRYQPNHAVLHTDTAVLPRRRRAWAAWNYRSDGAVGGDGAVSVHYLLNRLQPVPFTRPVIVSLNPAVAPDPATVLRAFDYAHPVFDGPALRAQRRLPALQGAGNVWFCGAWTGYGFHEDGLRSGLEVADAIAARAAAESVTEARLAA